MYNNNAQYALLQCQRTQRRQDTHTKLVYRESTVPQTDNKKKTTRMRWICMYMKEDDGARTRGEKVNRQIFFRVNIHLHARAYIIRKRMQTAACRQWRWANATNRANNTTTAAANNSNNNTESVEEEGGGIKTEKTRRRKNTNSVCTCRRCLLS